MVSTTLQRKRMTRWSGSFPDALRRSQEMPEFVGIQATVLGDSGALRPPPPLPGVRPGHP